MVTSLDSHFVGKTGARLTLANPTLLLSMVALLGLTLRRERCGIWTIYPLPIQSEVVDAQAVKSKRKPNVGCAIEDSTEGIWLLDHYFPHYRVILSPVAIHHGYLTNSEDLNEENINERVHWSVIAKRRGNATPSYNPRNLPADIPAEKIAEMTDEERNLLNGDE